jgi:catechol 2,3-dioxygenase-like lactoylglutathione lyase family enzyme
VKLRLDHVALSARSVGETHRFYSALLGLRVASAFELPGGGLQWSYDCADGRQIGFDTGEWRQPAGHVSFSVESAAERDAILAKLRAVGVPVRIEDPGPEERLYFEDPNGLTLEVELRWTPPIDDASLRLVLSHC